MNALVMYDHQTRTLWSQFLSKGVRGELVGVELDVIPLTQTNWGSWKELYPDTKLLSTGGYYNTDNYDSYYTSRKPGVIGEANRDERLNTKDLVVGVSFDGKTKAYPLSELSRRSVVNDDFAGRSALVYHDAPSGTALVYDRVVDGRELSFGLEGEPAGVQTVLVDEQTGSRWMAFSGLAIEGELKGRVIERLPSHLSFWFAWTDWNPETELFGG